MGASDSPTTLPAAAGAKSSGGSRSKTLAGIKMHANTTPSQRNTAARSLSVCCTSIGASSLLSRNAPMPKPITTMPVARPLRSGNHFATVATGVT